MDFILFNFTNSEIEIVEINVLVKDNFWRGSQNLLINEKDTKDPNYNSNLRSLIENDWILYDVDVDYISFFQLTS